MMVHEPLCSLSQDMIYRNICQSRQSKEYLKEVGEYTTAHRSYLYVTVGGDACIHLA